MLQSMSRNANCWNNAPMESFFKTLKVDRLYQLPNATRADARLAARKKDRRRRPPP
jgi:transposase InsO family protein